MPLSNSYSQAAQAYTRGVRDLFAPAGPVISERGRRSQIAVRSLADRAEQLAPRSAEMTQVATAELTSADPLARIQASTGLLAKALTDLEISATLLQAAEQEEGRPVPGRAAGIERGTAVSALDDLEANLRLVLGQEPPAAVRAAERTVVTLASLDDASTRLTQTIEDTLLLIRDRAAATGQSALSGVIGLGVSELASAAGIVGMDIAAALGQAEKVTRLYNLFREFLANAFQSLTALIGPALAQSAVDQAVTWVKDAVTGEKFGKLLDKFYGTAKTGEALKVLVSDKAAELARAGSTSADELARFGSAIEGVDALKDAYRQQIAVIEKLIKGLKWLSGIPAAALPQGKLIQAAAYLLIGGYVVLAGADFVDAQTMRLLDRVPGVRRVVEANLG